MTELYNILITIIFGMALLLSLLKLSLYPTKWILMAGVAWGIVAYLMVMMLSSTNNLLQSPEARYSSLVLLMFIDCLTFACFCVKRAEGKQATSLGKVLWFFPGVSLLLPLITCATGTILSFPGFDFKLLALIFGIAVTVVLISLSILIRRNLPSGKIIPATYYSAIVGFIICVIFCGIQ